MVVVSKYRCCLRSGRGPIAGTVWSAALDACDALSDDPADDQVAFVFGAVVQYLKANATKVSGSESVRRVGVRVR